MSCSQNFRNYFNLFTLLPVLIELHYLITGNAYSKVDPPNYNFSLNELAAFTPGTSKAEIDKKYGNGILISSKGTTQTYRYLVSQLRYKFPVIVQISDDKVLDFYATLPSYFLHDVFHQSLINRIGKQNRYFLIDEHATYVWDNAKNLRHVYSAACTITCFPIFYSVSKKREDWTGGYRPTVDTLYTLEKELKEPAVTKN